MKKKLETNAIVGQKWQLGLADTTELKAADMASRHGNHWNHGMNSCS